MKLRFYGADRCVTGSCHCLEVNGKHILVDCGLQQGRDEIDNTALPFHPGSIDVVLVTHAHIDHSGRIPMLIKNGFQGKIITTRLTADLLRAGEVIQPRLAYCEQIKYLASRFVNTQSCFFIGRGFDYALSLEGSLKLKEISYVHSDAYAAGELKHGTISLITDGVPVIALATQKQVYEKTISNAKETKSRGARVILFTTKDAVVPEGVADYVVRLDDYDELLMPLQLIVPLQLFAYYMAVLRGCDVDKPRNLAKSVTVE